MYAEQMLKNRAAAFVASTQAPVDVPEVQREMNRLANSVQIVNTLALELGSRLGRYTIAEPPSENTASIDTAVRCDAAREIRDITTVAEGTIAVLQQHLRSLAI